MGFYLGYAWRNVQRGGRWTALAVLCIAAGVASVVALRSLGLAIGDSLIENARIDNKGDMLITKGSPSQFATFFVNDDSPTFDAYTVEQVARIVGEGGGRTSAYHVVGNMQIARIDQSSVGRLEFVTTYYIDAQTYPPNYTITAIDPAGVPIAQLLDGEAKIVVSQNWAETHGVRVGDSVRISRTEQVFTVTGIVPTDNEAGLRNLFAAFFGFAYVDMQAAQRFINADVRPNNIAVVYPQPLTVEEDDALADVLRPYTNADGRRTSFYTANSLLRTNATIARVLGDFIVVMGLGALLIGGVGIMNTMLVMVRRRTNDIAALKTFGLKSRQIALLFFTEGTLLGALGCMAGLGLGVLLSGIVNQYGEAFLQQRLAWRIYPEALLYGVVLGMVITGVFSLAPILAALQVRPASILRPNEMKMPALSRWQAFFLLVFTVLSVGLIVGQIVRPSFELSERVPAFAPYVVGIIGVSVTLLVLGIMLNGFSLLVWLIGKLPSFGNPILRLALRNMAVYRWRTATTLLALSAGMFALSSISFFGAGARELLNLQLSRQLGGNVLALPIAPGGLGAGLARFAINGALASVPEGITHRNAIGLYEISLLAVDGRSIETIAPAANFESDSAVARFLWSGLIVWDSNNPNLYNDISTITSGRNLTLADSGQRFIIGPADSAAALGIRVGSRLRYDVEGEAVEFEVVGLTGGAGGAFLGNGGAVVPPNALGGSQPLFTFFTFQTTPEALNQTLVALSSIRIPPTFSLDVTFIDSLVSRLIHQFAALPTVVGLLSLLAAGVIMANTVALSTLERRRQIGILKAIGLKSRRVLAVMLLETLFIGGLSALIGIGLSSLLLTVLTSFLGTPLPLPVDARLTVVMLVAVAIGLSVLATFLSANVALRERVMNVLRYE